MNCWNIRCMYSLHRHNLWYFFDTFIIVSFFILLYILIYLTFYISFNDHFSLQTQQYLFLANHYYYCLLSVLTVFDVDLFNLATFIEIHYFLSTTSNIICLLAINSSNFTKILHWYPTRYFGCQHFMRRNVIRCQMK